MAVWGGDGQGGRLRAGGDAALPLWRPAALRGPEYAADYVQGRLNRICSAESNALMYAADCVQNG